MSSMQILQKLWQYRPVRFAAVGVVNTLTDLLLLNLLVFWLGMMLLSANVVSVTVSVSLSYIWNHLFVFNRRDNFDLRSFGKFFVITTLGIVAIQSSVIYILERTIHSSDIAHLFGVKSAVAQLILVDGIKLVAVFCAMTWNFTLYSLVVFRTRPAKIASVSTETVIS